MHARAKAFVVAYTLSLVLLSLSLPYVSVSLSASCLPMPCREDIDPDRIFVLGRSIGGAVALHLAETHQHHISGLIVENTFTSTTEIVS